MARTLRTHALQLLIASALLMGCGRKASEEIDLGTFKQSEYSNRYFGLTITLPADWSVQDQETRDQLTKMGTEAVFGGDKNLKAMAKAAEMQTVNLFTAMEKPLGSPVPYNPSIMAFAERVKHLPGIQRGKDYQFQVRKTLESSQMQIAFPRDGYTERLSNEEFDVMEQTITVRGITVRQKYYSIIRKGYALSFVLSFTTDAEEAPMRKALNTLTFH